MRRIIIIAIIFLTLLVTRVFAETSIKAQVDKNIITTDETLTYKITISSSKETLPSPVIPKFDDFKVISSSQSSTISFIKSSIQTQVAYEFILVPAGTGKFKIEPSRIKINNQTYSTVAFEIEVRLGKFKPKIEPQQKPSLPIPKESRPESEEPQITL